MDFSQFQGFGYGTAVAVGAIAVFFILWRSWEGEERRRRKIRELRQKYNEAVDARNLELAATIAVRLRKLEAEGVID